jgi:predicted Zn finger-like uncharacterized protein
MRIVCQKCSAAYAIDDKFVTPKGVRAQCPRCRHLQLVKKDDAAAAPAPAEPVAPPNPFAQAGADELFDLSAPASATSPGLPSQPPAGSGVGSDGRELMDFSELGLPAGQGGGEFFAAPPEPQSFPAPQPGPGAYAAPPSPFGAPASPFGSADFGSPSSPFGAAGTGGYGGAGPLRVT